MTGNMKLTRVPIQVVPLNISSIRLIQGYKSNHGAVA